MTHPEFIARGVFFSACINFRLILKTKNLITYNRDNEPRASSSNYAIFVVQL